MTFPLPHFGVFPYAATVARKYLLTRVPEIYTIETLIPAAPRPRKLIVVRSIPGGRVCNIIEQYRRLLVWNYDVDENTAGNAAENTLGYLIEAQFTRHSGIRETKLVGSAPYYFPDPDDPADTPRFQFTVDILLRAHVTPS
jgi:hypothetical protein